MATRKNRTAAPKLPKAARKTTPPPTPPTTTRSGSSRAGAQNEVKPTQDQIARRANETELAGR